MADTTGIEWCDATINLWIGCRQLTAACDHCYAMKLAKRFGIKWNAPPVRTKAASWSKIAQYQRAAKRFFKLHGRRRRVFINSLSDFFDNQAEQDWRNAACSDMALSPDVIFILVTKRPQNVTRMVPGHWLKPGGWPENVWLLTTTENQVEYDRRFAELMVIPGPHVIGVSMEPLFEPINPGRSLSGSAVERMSWAQSHIGRRITSGVANRMRWAIIGGESGKDARPMPAVQDLAILETTLSTSDVAVFTKQMSAAQHPKTFKDYETFPKSLKRREFPS